MRGTLRPDALPASPMGAPARLRVLCSACAARPRPSLHSQPVRPVQSVRHPCGLRCAFSLCGLPVLLRVRAVSVFFSLASSQPSPGFSLCLADSLASCAALCFRAVPRFLCINASQCAHPVRLCQVLFVLCWVACAVSRLCICSALAALATLAHRLRVLSLYSACTQPVLSFYSALVQFSSATTQLLSAGSALLLLLSAGSALLLCTL